METEAVDLQAVEPELNLLLQWPDERGHRWSAILGSSLSVHLLFFFLAVQLPSFVRLATPPAQTVIVKRTPLYLPRDIMTQRAPNRAKPSKQIDLADLLASEASHARAPIAAQPTKRFELPKQTTPQQVAKNMPPQILAAPPSVALNDAPVPAAPPPSPQAAPPDNPFQNVAPQAQRSTKLAAPKNSVQTAIQQAHASSRKVVISDDSPSEPQPGSPNSIEHAAAQHAAIELESDPQGADFKPYLARILAIVRSNWRTVIPESVRMGTRRGRTVVEFAINRDGSIPKLVIADPSGSEPLDRAAVAGLSMSNPLPPLPSDYKGMQVRLAFSFAYNMPAQ